MGWNITVIVLHYLSIQLGAIILRDETLPEKSCKSCEETLAQRTVKPQREK